MFDIGASELLVIVVVAILVIGPKEMPRALRTAGQWMGKIRRVSTQFRTGIDAMIREAELEEAEKEWKQRNADIMAKSAQTAPDADRPDKLAEPENLLPKDQMQATQVPPPRPVESGSGGEAAEHNTSSPDPDAAAEAAIARAAPDKAPEHGGTEPTKEPQLPLDDDASAKKGD